MLSYSSRIYVNLCARDIYNAFILINYVRLFGIPIPFSPKIEYLGLITLELKD